VILLAFRQLLIFFFFFSKRSGRCAAANLTPDSIRPAMWGANRNQQSPSDSTSFVGGKRRSRWMEIGLARKSGRARRDGDGTFLVASRGLHLRLVTHSLLPSVIASTALRLPSQSPPDTRAPVLPSLRGHWLS